MAFFDQLFNAAPGAGAASPSAFTSPGMNPQMLSALMAMQRGAPGAPGAALPGAGASPGMPGGPPIPSPAQSAGAGGAPNLAIPAVQGPQQNSMLAQLMANPNLLKSILGQATPNAAGAAGLFGPQNAAAGAGQAANAAMGAGGVPQGLFGLLGTLFGGR